MKQTKREFNGTEVRVINKNGQTMIHLRDLFRALGYKDPGSAWASNFKHEDVTIINGMGAARAAYASVDNVRMALTNLTDAQDFTDWLDGQFPETRSTDLSSLLTKLKAFRDDCLSTLADTFADGSYQDEIKDAVSEVASTLGVAIGNQKVQELFG